jgi:hypothetical protein
MFNRRTLDFGRWKATRWKTTWLSLLLPLFGAGPAFSADDPSVLEEYRDIVRLCEDGTDVGVHIIFPEHISPEQPFWDLSRYHIALKWANSGDGDGRGRGKTLQVYCGEAGVDNLPDDQMDMNPLP